MAYNPAVPLLRAVHEALRLRPFLVAAVAAAAGIIFATRLELSPALSVGVMAMGALTLLAAMRARNPGPAIWLAAAAFGFAAGLVRMEMREHKPANDISRLGDAECVTIRGRALEVPRYFGTLEDVSERHQPPSGAFPLEIASVEVGARPLNCVGRVRVQFYRSEVQLRGGEEVIVSGRLRRPPERTNPGVYDRAAALEREGIGAILIADSVTLQRPAPAADPRTVLNSIRRTLRDALSRHAPRDAAALQSALLLGWREQLPADLVTALQRSGTAHFLAISGCNLVLILSIFWFILQLAGLRGPAMHGTLLAILLIYTALTGWQVSVVRAFLMSASVLVAALCGRRSRVANSMALSALIIWAFDPAQLFDTGFQLSFAAVLGIVGVAPIFHDFLAQFEPVGRAGLFAGLGRHLRAALAVSLGAWLATAPIVLATFNLATPVILVANLLLFPLISLQALLGIATLPFAAVLPPAADAIGWASAGVFHATWACADGLTRIPYAYLFAPAMPPLWMLGYYAVLIAWTAWSRLRPSTLKPWLCTAFALALTAPPLAAPAPPVPVFGVIDVGRGSSAFVRRTDGRVTVFDCGSLSYRDVGATVVAPVLWSRGITRVEALVLSHDDADHVNGAASLIERLRVRRLVVPPRFAASDLLEFARSRGIEVIRASRGTRIGDLEFLGPPEPERLGARWPSNEGSLVVRLHAGPVRVLLPGDIEERGTAALLEDRVDVRCDVLVVPHHGKFQKLHDRLAEAAGATLALVSGPIDYASAEVLDTLRSRGHLHVTGEEGYLECLLRPSGIEVLPYGSR